MSAVSPLTTPRMSDRRRPPNAWIRWDRIQPDYEAGMPAWLCAQRENTRLTKEGKEKRRVKPKHIRNMAYLKGWSRPFDTLLRNAM